MRKVGEVLTRLNWERNSSDFIFAMNIADDEDLRIGPSRTSGTGAGIDGMGGVAARCLSCSEDLRERNGFRMELRLWRRGGRGGVWSGCCA